jgi:hypothetical protein
MLLLLLLRLRLLLLLPGHWSHSFYVHFSRRTGI